MTVSDIHQFHPHNRSFAADFHQSQHFLRQANKSHFQLFIFDWFFVNGSELSDSDFVVPFDWGVDADGIERVRDVVTVVEKLQGHYAE